MDNLFSQPNHDNFFEWKNLSIALTDCCNLQCRMCPVVNRSHSSLTWEQALDVADFACSRHIGQVVVGGGEPTLMSYFWDFMDVLAEGGMSVMLLTNAYRLSHEQMRHLANYPKLLVNVSVDGIGDVHNHIRGAGTFEATTRNIQQLLDSGCRVAVNTAIQRSNYKTLKELYEWFVHYPLEWHRFQYVEYGGHEEHIPVENVAESIDILAELVKQYGSDSYRLGISMGMIETYRLWHLYPKLKKHPGLGCTVARRQITVAAEHGRVAPCWHFLDWPIEDMFDIRHRRLGDIVDSPEYRSAVERAIGPDGCAGCGTLCYCWDPDFNKKLFHPPLYHRIKHYFMLYHPNATSMVSTMRHLLLP